MQNKKDSINDYRVVSLFSGGGGLDLGFKQAGFNIVWAIDNNQDAVDTYRHNIGDYIICADITKISIKDIPDIPDTANIPNEDKERILKQGIFEEFVILKKPKIRSVDKVWAKTLFGDKWEETLNEAKDLLTRLANARDVERIS